MIKCEVCEKEIKEIDEDLSWSGLKHTPERKVYFCSQKCQKEFHRKRLSNSVKKAEKPRKGL